MRRLLVEQLEPGEVRLSRDQAHHARDVLRLRQGDEVELFTAAGQTARGTLTSIATDEVLVRVGEIADSRPAALQLMIASAIPKAARADWMIEKLSELGVYKFIPLITDRSVVHPEGKGKLARWQRLAGESAKQSQRPGVMRIAPLTPVRDVLRDVPADTTVLPLCTGADAKPFSSILPFPPSMLLLVGPEGDWSDAELKLFSDRHLTPISLGATILRVETAAIAAAAVVAALTAPVPESPT
jgi:16S rRNA (uracil1498-N3)-methyltransferase